MTFGRRPVNRGNGITAYIYDESTAKYDSEKCRFGGSTLASFIEDQVDRKKAGRKIRHNRGTARLHEDAVTAIEAGGGKPVYSCLGCLFREAKDRNGRQFFYSVVDGGIFTTRSSASMKIRTFFKDYLEGRGIGTEKRDVDKRLALLVKKAKGIKKIRKDNGVEYFNYLDIFWIDSFGQQIFCSERQVVVAFMSAFSEALEEK